MIHVGLVESLNALMCRLHTDEHVLWVSSDGLYLAVVLQIFYNIRKHYGNCYMDSFWPQSGRDVQDNRMLRFCLFSLWGEFNTIWALFTHVNAVNLSERVQDYLCALPHLWFNLSIWCYHLNPHLRIYACNMQVIDTVMRCGFELNENYSCREHWLS